VELDPNISVQSGTLPYTALGGNRYRVNIGTLNPGQCVSFRFSGTVSLNARALQTLCMAAELFPQPICVFDTTPNPYQPGSPVAPCTLPWDRSSLSVTGRCDGDSVRFVIRNTGELGGGNMQCHAPVRVLRDGQLIIQDSLRINGGDSAVYVFAGNAQTWRLEADQHPLHPGRSRPNATIENCGPGIGFAGIPAQFPQDDADPIIDRFCGQVTAPLDPNDKTGFPTGWGAENNILRNQDIEYLIRFQNVGTDTAFNVVIRDTLSTDFDIFSIRSGASSFPYTFRMYGPRVLEWTFTDIRLPDSTTNEPESNGFVTFRVRQNPNLPYGTVLENTAAIYFDFEEPVITNTTLHTVSPPPGRSPDSRRESLLGGLRIYPNPSTGQVTVDMGTLLGQPATLRVMSLTGQVLQSHTLPQGTLTQVLQIPTPGLYLIEVRSAGHSRTEKVVVY
jgi:uncharacterized repeat protein (TIGR01451 family)